MDSGSGVDDHEHFMNEAFKMVGTPHHTMGHS
jgi:hypothetical protein